MAPSPSPITTPTPPPSLNLQLVCDTDRIRIDAGGFLEQAKVPMLALDSNASTIIDTVDGTLRAVATLNTSGKVNVLFDDMNAFAMRAWNQPTVYDHNEVWMTSRAKDTSTGPGTVRKVVAEVKVYYQSVTIPLEAMRVAVNSSLMGARPNIEASAGSAVNSTAAASAFLDVEFKVCWKE